MRVIENIYEFPFASEVVETEIKNLGALCSPFGALLSNILLLLTRL